MNKLEAIQTDRLYTIIENDEDYNLIIPSDSMDRVRLKGKDLKELMALKRDKDHLQKQAQKMIDFFLELVPEKKREKMRSYYDSDDVFILRPDIELAYLLRDDLPCHYGQEGRDSLRSIFHLAIEIRKTLKDKHD